MTTRVNLSHNVDDVISGIDDVKDDLRAELRKRLGAAMNVLWQDVRANIRHDPHNTGNLLRSIQRHTNVGYDELEFTVGVRGKMVDYAAIVEYGSGERTNNAPMVANLAEWDYPPNFPYESPDIDYNQDNPIDTEGFPKFFGFLKHIETWMKSKPIKPDYGNYFVSAAYIAATIIEKGNFAHPYLRPAWFRQEPNIKQAAKHAVKRAV